MYDQFAVDVYESLCGLLVAPVAGVEDAFLEGSLCAKKKKLRLSFFFLTFNYQLSTIYSVPARSAAPQYLPG